jgi:hypothetical protein
MPKGEGQQAKATAITKNINRHHTQPPFRLRPDVTNEFPAHLIPMDAYDDVAALKKRIGGENPINGKKGQKGVQYQARITKDDIDYLKRKQEVTNKLRYQKWLLSTIDMSDPVQGTFISLKSVCDLLIIFL